MDVKIVAETGQCYTVNVPGGETLSRALWLYAGLPAPHLCNGLGLCGLCRVRFDAAEPLLCQSTTSATPLTTPSPTPTPSAPPPLEDERAILGDAVEQGWRLACRHTVADTCGLRIEVPGFEGFAAEEVSPFMLRPGAKPLRLAVDVGTTSIHWQLLGEDGSIVGRGQALNPQSGAGSDVVSRLAAASSAEGLAKMSQLVRRFVRTRIVEAEKAHPAMQVVECCVAANTAMTTVFMEHTVDGLMAAPYSRPIAGGETIYVPGLPPVWIPPQPAPFVGGDIAAGMVAVLHSGAVYPFVLADMGTNGEMVLALDAERSFITSVPLGPALEGIGLSCGGLAGPGSITGFSLGAQGLVPRLWGDGEPRSLSGTGILSLLDVLIRAGVLEATGQLRPEEAVQLPLAKKLLAGTERSQSGWRIRLPGGLFVTADDVEAVLKVRAAFSVAFMSLLRAAQCDAASLTCVLLAGSLGEHAPVATLERLGFFPQGMGARVKAVGNASLAGAALFLQDHAWRGHSGAWSTRCVRVDVTDETDFMERFVAAMRLDALHNV